MVKGLADGSLPLQAKKERILPQHCNTLRANMAKKNSPQNWRPSWRKIRIRLKNSVVMKFKLWRDFSRSRNTHCVPPTWLASSKADSRNSTGMQMGSNILPGPWRKRTHSIASVRPVGRFLEFPGRFPKSCEESRKTISNFKGVSKAFFRFAPIMDEMIALKQIVLL